MLGVLLDHRYRVLETLSKGGFGQTYIAEDTRRPGNPKCLVKHLTPASHEKEFLDNARRLFQMEAVTLERLGHHDQIPRLLAYFEDNAEFYLVQELVNGHPISREIIPGQPWNEPRIIRLLHEVLKILVFVHDCGVIHRDIKPDNLLRRYQDQKIVLVDFGSVKQIRSELLAQNEHQITRTISIGTIGYMATEQSRGKPRLSSDVYSLGIIGIQAATGLNPNQFQEDNQTGELVWRNSASQISAELAAILTRMVCYHFKDRYKSAQDALFDVERLLGLEPTASMDASVNGGWSPSSFSTVAPSQSNSSTSDAPLPPQAPVAPTALSLPENGAANGHANSEVATHEPQAYKSDLPLTVLSGIPGIVDEAAAIEPEVKSEPEVSSEPEVYSEPESAIEPESTIESKSSSEQALNVEEEATGAIATPPLPNASPLTEMSLSSVETEPPIAHTPSASSTVEPQELVEPVQSVESTQLAEPVYSAESTQVIELPHVEATHFTESTQSVEFIQAVKSPLAVESSHLADPLEAVESTDIEPIESTDSDSQSNVGESDSQQDVASLNAGTLTEQEHLEPLSPTLAESPMQRVRNNITQFRKFYVYGAMGLGLGLAVFIPSLNSWNTYREELRLVQNSLQSAESQRAKGQYEDCLATAETIPETFSDLHQQALNLQGVCLLNQAQELADENRLRDAIALAQSVPPDTEAAEDALEKIDDWFGRILQIAENKYQEQNLAEAITIARAVTNDSSLYDSTQELIGGWQAELDIWNQANEAFSGKQWEGAIAQAEKISDDSSLKELADELIAIAQGEIRRAEAARQAATSQNNATTGSSSSPSSSGQSTSGSRPAPTPPPPPPPPPSPNPPGSGTLRDF